MTEQALHLKCLLYNTLLLGTQDSCPTCSMQLSNCTRAGWPHDVSGCSSPRRSRTSSCRSLSWSARAPSAVPAATAPLVLHAGLMPCADAAVRECAGCAAGGVLTPASAMRMVLVQLLHNACISCRITSSSALGKQQKVEAVATGVGEQWEEGVDKSLTD
ncbi:hypothetical protein OEZ85_009115 [Tetradesmus obliquus]|uniref:Uncharacterized protein n=1 Tax=Tetradesmus obliquus TaxID=3088 RepID=A0ABY8TPM5_TETOB|nr:hypothetical protein OEZ85_009115 [Tetradesmus obliquus]